MIEIGPHLMQVLFGIGHLLKFVIEAIAVVVILFIVAMKL